MYKPVKKDNRELLQFICDNADNCDTSDMTEIYCKIWKAKFNELIESGYISTDSRHTSVAYVNEIRTNDRGDQYNESYDVDMNQTPEIEAAKVNAMVLDRFGSHANFELSRTFNGTHGSKFCKLIDVSTNSKDKFETSRHDTDDVYRFVAYLLTGEIPAYADALAWRDSSKWDEPGKPGFLEAAELPRNPDKGKYNIEIANYKIECQQFSNGKLILSNLPDVAIQRWNHYHNVIQSSWWDSYFRKQSTQPAKDYDNYRKTPDAQPDLSTLPVAPITDYAQTR